ncbi:MAG: hypothetical protein AAF800_11785 [Planctomycetota bacterium]
MSGVKTAAAATLGLAAAAVPATGWAVARWGDAELVRPAVVATAIVWAASLVSLVPVWMTRHADPARRSSARLAHLVLRLLLTAGGLAAYLVTLPEPMRRPVGFVALGWYAAGWAVDLWRLKRAESDTPPPAA